MDIKTFLDATKLNNIEGHLNFVNTELTIANNQKIEIKKIVVDITGFGDLKEIKIQLPPEQMAAINQAIIKVTGDLLAETKKAFKEL